MAITSLSLTNFRNHSAFILRPEARFIVLHGPNGAGKTNILEAVSILVPGRGLRRAALGEMARSGRGRGFTVSAELGDVAIGTGTDASAPERRKVRINGANATANSLSDWLAVMWLTPAMDRLFTDGASNRRRFMDRLVLALEPGHAAHSNRYEQCLRQRNRLLSDERTPDPAWLDGIEMQMAQSAAAINGARNRMISDLSQQLANEPAGPFAIPVIELDAIYCQDSDAIRKMLSEARKRDRSAGRTLSGPHRADFIAHHKVSGQMASQCSTGEQKALLLSIILAHAALVTEQRGTAPILLLDEVAAHLDPVRRAALYERLASTGCQVWMTGTEATLFDDVGALGHFIALDNAPST